MVGSTQAEAENAPRATQPGSSSSYFRLKIFNKYIYAIADSGTEVSIVSAKLLPSEILEELDEYSGKVVGAEGSPLNCMGQLTTEIEIADQKLQLKALVVNNLQQDMLIGATFFRENHCVLDYGKLSFKIKDATIPLLSITGNEEKAYKALLCRTIEIPAHSMIDNVRVKCKENKNGRRRQNIACTAIFEPGYNMLECEHDTGSEHLLINVSNGESAVRILNPSDNPITMYRNQAVGIIRTLAGGSASGRVCIKEIVNARRTRATLRKVEVK